MNVSNAKFDDNRATTNGGAIYNTSSGTAENPNTITNSIFTNNSAVDGGAIYNSDTLTIENSSFVGNIASGNGGAIFNSGTLTVKNSIFDNNSATGYGGAIYNSGNLTLSTTEGNTLKFNKAYDTIYNAMGSTITINPFSADSMVLNSTLTNLGTININNNFNLNGTISQSGADANTNINGNTITLQSGGDITGGIINVTENAILNMIDSNVRDVFSGTSLNISNVARLTLNMDVDLSGSTVTSDKVSSTKTSSSAGNIIVKEINITATDFTKNTINLDTYAEAELKNIIGLATAGDLKVYLNDKETIVYSVGYDKT